MQSYNEYLEVISDELTSCHRTIVQNFVSVVIEAMIKVYDSKLRLFPTDPRMRNSVEVIRKIKEMDVNFPYI
ncbi:MAG: hypothetical protein GF329_07860 [Candidatus Lokiarchaeota archaeon]|nr:hypothetical protein [Candidatus Lokiarchaeota archaeon]